jgi:hypothetical protein
VLNLILDDLELTCLVKDEVLQITTPQDAQAATEIRIYDCRDLLAMPATAKEKAVAMPGGDSGGFGSGRGRMSEHEQRAAQLMTIITTNVDPHSWHAPQGGVADSNAAVSASVSEYNGLIVVTQTAPTHQKIERVLDMLREAAGLEVQKSGKVVR